MSTGDKARDGCAKMIYKALALYEGASKYFFICKLIKTLQQRS